MEKGGLYKYYSELPMWAKGVVAVAVISGIGIASYAIYKKIKETKDLKGSQETADSAEDEYKKLVKQGQKLSFPAGNYISASNTIKNSLDGCETYVGEEDAVYAVINVVKKPIDWYFLVKTFGSRMISDCGFGETAYALPELLRGQLGSLSPSAFYLKSNLAYLNDYLKKTIGITI